MFILSDYWGTWSRILSESHSVTPFVEVNLTPLRPPSWEDVRPIRIRAHCTARGMYSHDDRYKPRAELPSDIIDKMKRNLGNELTERLLTEDFYPQIDWGLFRQKNNGGAHFEDIRRR